MSTRRTALDILERVEQGAWASPLIEAARLEERDRRFVRTLVMAVLRWRSRIDFVIGHLTGRSLGRLDPPVLDLLRLGVAQLMFTDVAPHAAVNETVSLATGRAARGKGLVNAVLRRASRTALRDILPDDDTRAEVETAHPGWMLDRWTALYGRERAVAIANANQELSRSDLVVNTRVTDLDAVISTLDERGLHAVRSSIIPDMLRIEESTSAIGDLLEQGIVYPMDEGSAAVARAVMPVPGETVLDLCAAPGGKSLVLGLIGARVIANDISWSRLQLLRRMWPAVMGNVPEIVVSDGRNLAVRRPFSRILVDAPCSATGTIRRNPEIRWRTTPELIASFSRLQIELLTGALEHCTHEVLYATCSLEPEENDEVVAAAVKLRPGWRLIPAVEQTDGPLVRYADGPVLRLTPESGTDGFTVHRLRRTE